MALPVFKITMLGHSGVGKTVYMSSMYAKLRDARDGIGIRARRNDDDLELDQTMRDLFSENIWPPGTELNEKKYEFELRLRQNPIATIDWVDYRGGILRESNANEGGTTLVRRLQQSHCVIWMIDMSELEGQYNTTRARVLTGVGRMSQLTRQAMDEGSNLRSVLVVRTKSDEVLGTNGKPDLNKACEELQELLGAFNFSDVPCSAAIPVSSVGRVVGEKRLVGDDPYNVEWPLILALAYLLDTELGKLNRAKDGVLRELEEAKPGKVGSFIKDTLGIGPDPGVLKISERFEQLSQHEAGISEVIKQLLRNRPQSIKILQELRYLTD